MEKIFKKNEQRRREKKNEEKKKRKRKKKFFSLLTPRLFHHPSWSSVEISTLLIFNDVHMERFQLRNSSLVKNCEIREICCDKFYKAKVVTYVFNLEYLLLCEITRRKKTCALNFFCKIIIIKFIETIEE